MEQYSICKMLGEGSYGIVWKALDLETGEEVAIKALKNNYPSWEKCKAEWGRKHPLSEDTIRDMTSHLLQGLCCIHGKGYFHRDLKPENLLLKSGVLKIADFGMARDVNSSLPLEKEVTTLWYRAPEVLLGKTYDEKIDMWAVGVIMAELYNSEPLFPGANNVDQLHRIWEVAGVSDDLRDPLEFDRKQNLHSTLRRLIPRASEEAIDLIRQLLSWNPTMRPTAFRAFFHSFFNTKDVYKHPTPKRHRSKFAPIGPKIAAL